MTTPFEIVISLIILQTTAQISGVSLCCILSCMSQKHFQRNDMHIIICFANLPKAVRHTVHSADVILIFIKRGYFILEVMALSFARDLRLSLRWAPYCKQHRCFHIFCIKKSPETRMVTGLFGGDGEIRTRGGFLPN